METKTEALIGKIMVDVIPTMSPRWERVELFPPLKNQDEHDYTLYMRGITKDIPHKFYLAWVYISPKDLERGDQHVTRSYLEMKAKILALKLDDFLNPLCQCVPGPDGRLGEPCAYHSGRLYKPTRFPEGAEL